MTVSKSVLDRINTVVEQYVEDEAIDFNEGSAGGGRLLPEGKALGRLVAYVEFGPQLSKAYPNKPPQNRFKLGFAIWGKAKNGETYHTMEGNVMKPGIVRSKPINVTNDLNQKSGAYKLFKRMNPDKTAKHFAQLLNHTFILPIVHSEDGQGEQKKVYANIDLDNIMLAVDPVTDAPYNVPEVTDESLFQIFLWNKPTKEDWDALYIEGKNDDGKSKNYIQETILSSPAFPGSALEVLLGGGAGIVDTLPELPVEDTVGDLPEAPEELPVAEPEQAAAEPEKPKAGKGKAKDKEPAATDTGASDDFGLPSL